MSRLFDLTTAGILWSVATLSLLVACGRDPALLDSGAHKPAGATTVDLDTGLLPLIQVDGESYAPWTLEERMAHYHVPGLSVAVFRDGEIIWARGYGVADQVAGSPATAKTQFAAGPFAMSLTAIAAARLAADQLIDLDAKVATVVESWRPQAEAEASRTTLRQLLNHIAGVVPAKLRRIPGTGPMPSLLEVLEGSGRSIDPAVSWIYRPGLRYAYSEAGYAVAESMLTDAVGREFSELVAEAVIQPLRLEHSVLAAGAPPAQGFARPHDALGQPITDFGRAPSLAADGLWTTASDFAQLMIAVQGSAKGEGGFLSSAIASQVLRSGLSSQGLGFEVLTRDGPERFLVSGVAPGGYALAWSHLRRAEGAVVLANGARGEMLCLEVLQAMARQYDWLGLASAKSDGGTLSALLPLVGAYRLPLKSGDTPIIRLTLDNGRLKLEAGPGVFPGEDQVNATLYPVAGEYAMSDRPQKIDFEYRQETIAVAMILDGVRAPRIEGGGGSPAD